MRSVPSKLLAMGLLGSLALLCFSCAGGGTEGTYGRSVMGEVVEDANNDGVDEPVPGASVELLETGATATTDANGAFEFPRQELSGESFTLQVSRDSTESVVELQNIPATEVAIDVTILLKDNGEAETKRVVVEERPTPTPTVVPPTATSAPQPTPTTASTPVASPTSNPTEVPTSPPLSTPSPSPTTAPTSGPGATPSATATPTATPVPSCPDVDGNGVVDLTDLSTVLSNLGCDPEAVGASAQCIASDVTNDGDVNDADRLWVQANFGTTCP